MNPPQSKALVTYSSAQYKGKKDNSQGRGQNAQGQQGQ